jgi:hypothetical protein
MSEEVQRNRNVSGAGFQAVNIFRHAPIVETKDDARVF